MGFPRNASFYPCKTPVRQVLASINSTEETKEPEEETQLLIPNHTALSGGAFIQTQNSSIPKPFLFSTNLF